jgi:hypothetical protein
MLKYCTPTVLAVMLMTVGLPSVSIGEESAAIPSPAHMSIQIPPASKRSGIVMLELALKAVGNSEADHLGGVVRLSNTEGNSVEIGRFSILTSSFKATNPDEEQRFQFNITNVVKQLDLAGRPADVEVTLIDRASGNNSVAVELIIGQVEILLR